MGIRASVLAVVLCGAVALTAGAQSADQAGLFKEAALRDAALRRELATARPGTAAPTQQRVRTLVGAFEDLARIFPATGQADKALWQGASLSADTFFKFGDEVDRATAVRLLASLSNGYPGSSYARQAAPLGQRLQDSRTAAPAASSPKTTAAVPSANGARTAPAASPVAAPSQPRTATLPSPAAAPAPAGPPREPGLVTLGGVRREVLAEAVRVTIDLDREVPYYSERIPGPDRIFVDLPRTRTVSALKAAVLPFADDVVRRVRVGEQPGEATRVVLDLDRSGRHSIYTLYNPYRIVVDVERPRADTVRTPIATTRPAVRPALAPVTPAVAPAAVSASSTPAPSAAARADIAVPALAVPAVDPLPPSTEPESRPASARAARSAAAAAGIAAVPATQPPLDTPPPVPAALNARGGFSLSRQLGLGIARVVIDAGHGGHDPGARVKGLSEAELTLDIALRLEKLLLRQPGVEVVQTRRTNAYVALEERTEIANRSEADLFLSIHANASTDRRARGVETYFLSFAPDAEAEAIAARENAGSTRQMRQLPELLRAIAFNNKLDESRDLARMVQQALYTQARKSDKKARNLGVKQAPFTVLVGAAMPSVLTEISFLTNQQDAGLLATEKYRQQIAEALLAGITRYQQSLKKGAAVAAQ